MAKDEAKQRKLPERVHCKRCGYVAEAETIEQCARLLETHWCDGSYNRD